MFYLFVVVVVVVVIAQGNIPYLLVLLT